MKMTMIFLLVSSLGLAITAEARPRDPRRERARCNANLSLCNRVADDDYRGCVRARLGNCSEKRDEDLDSCKSDHKSCLDRIGRVIR